jgi:hypothetical protein
MCQYPYINSNLNTTDCITYGDYIGYRYTIYYSIFLSLSILCFLLTTLQTTKLFLKKNTKIKNNFQFLILILSTVMSLFVLIQNIDPYNYYAIYPKIIESLFSNLTTDIGLIILFLFISNYLKVLSFMDKDHKIFYVFSCLIIILSTFIFSFLETYVNYGLFRGIRLIMLSLICLGSTLGLNILMLKVLKMLTLLNTDDSVEELKQMKNKLLRYTLTFDIFILIIIGFQLYTAINSFSNNSVLIPNISPDMVFFRLAQIIGILFVIFFTYKKVNKTYSIKIQRFSKIKNKITICCKQKLITNIESNIINNDSIENDIDFNNIDFYNIRSKNIESKSNSNNQLYDIEL